MKRSILFIGNPLWVFAFLSMVVFTSCQKEDLMEDQAANTADVVQISDHEVERLILERYFRIETSSLHDEALMSRYNEVLSTLPPKAQASLTDVVARVHASHEATGTNQLARLRRKGGSKSQTAIAAPVPAERFAADVDISLNRIYAGSQAEQSVYEFLNSSSAPLLNTITPNVPAEGFGESFSVSGNWMAVGATGAFGDPGQVFIFKKMEGSWVEQQILTGPITDNAFGVALELKGNTLVVTSFGPLDPMTSTIAGTISVFRRIGNQWQLVDTITRPDNLWLEVDLNLTGTRIVASSIINFDLAVIRASVFSLTPSGYTFDQEIIVPNTDAALPGDVRLSFNRILLTSFEPGDRQFLFTLNGGNWTFAQELIHPLGDFGTNRAGDIQANRIVIGAGSGNDSIPEAVYAFDKQGGTFNLTETFIPADAGVDLALGEIAIQGNNIVVGSRGDFQVPGSTGRVVVFKMW
ncbi:MAG: hypothetical protein AAF135_00480 [Bacteroidota bacterium]